MKIIVFAIISIVCFAGYVLIFGAAMGVNPGQLTLAFGSSTQVTPDANANTEDHNEDTNSPGDSLQASVSDSVAATQSQAPVDTLQEQIASISKQKAELEKLRTEVTTILKAKAKADSAQISNLAKMYDGVEPAQLAQVMANMDDSLVIAILPRLKSQKAGKILEQMPAERAARISSKLIGYN